MPPPEQPLGQASRRLGKEWYRQVNALLLVLGVLACLWLLAELVGRSALVLVPEPRAILAIALLNLLAVLLVFLLWRHLVGVMARERVLIPESLVGQAALMVGKYVPGKIVGLVGRTMSIGQTVPTFHAVAIVAAEQAYMIMGLALLGLSLTGYLSGSSWMLALASSILLGATLFPRVVALLGPVVERRMPKLASTVEVISRPRFRDSLKSVVLALGAALCVTVVAWFVPDLLNFEANAALRWQLVGSYALSIVAGMLVFFLPGGIGAREGALVVFLQTPLGIEAALGVAVVLRLVNVFVDLGMGFVGLLLARWTGG